MSVVRVHKNANFTVMSNYHFKEKNMSLKAKGLLSLMLSLPDDWDYSIAGLVTLSKDGKDSVMSALAELLERISNFDKKLQKTILENAIINNWRSVYLPAEKEDDSGGTQYNKDKLSDIKRFYEGE